MNPKPRKIIWSVIPGSKCNLNCEYCYTSTNKGKPGRFLYPVEHMIRCFEPSRFGGPIIFGGAAAGETLLWDGIVDFTRGLLSQGHFVSYTTNMTMRSVIRKFCEFPRELRVRLELDASLHYLELKKLNMLDVFFENLRALKEAEISYAIYLCISDSYLPYVREVSALCKSRAGILPVASMVRKYSEEGATLAEPYSKEIEDLVEATCDTRQWKLQKKLYGQKRNEFCHAGQCSMNLNLGTGDYTKCWGRSRPISGLEKFVEKSPSLIKKIGRRFVKTQAVGNIFKNPKGSIKFEPIGKCPFFDCVCASYLVWGLIPEMSAPTHSNVYYDRAATSSETWDFWDTKLIAQK